MWKSILIGIMLFLLVVVLPWQVRRWWHYTWSYESKVHGTVCEMVKPEALKDPTQCE